MTNQPSAPSARDEADAIYTQDVPAERPWSRIIKRGQTLRIIDSEGQQAVDALLYCADDRAERYSAQDTLRGRAPPMSSSARSWSRTEIA